MARSEKDRRKDAYRFYVTDALKIIGDLNMRYADVITPVKEDNRSPEEIKNGIFAKLEAAGHE